MKNIIPLLITILLSQIVAAQQFQFFNTEDEIFFEQEEQYKPKSYSFEDQKAVSGGVMYYPTKFAYLFLNEESEYYHINPNTSFIGDSVYLDSENNTTVYNSNGFNLFFPNFSNPSDWIVFEEENGAYIKGKHISLDNGFILTDFEGLYTTIQLLVYDSLGTELIDHPMNAMELNISDDFGIMNPFYINNFKGIYFDYENDDFNQYTLSGVKSDASEYGDRPKYLDIITSIEPTTETHIIFKTHSYNYEVKKKVIEKIVNDPYITYVYQNCIHRYNYISDTTYMVDTLMTYNYKMHVNEVFDSVDASGEEGFLYTHSYGGGSGDTYYKPYFTYTTNYKTGEFEENQNIYWYLRPDFNFSWGISGVHIFLENLGEIIPYWGEEGSEDEIVYYKTPYEEWGTPLDFECPDYSGISETHISNISLYPNPAEDIIYVYSPQNIELVLVYDLQGRLTESFELNENKKIDVSDLSKGVYLLQIKTKNSETKHKLIIR